MGAQSIQPGRRAATTTATDTDTQPTNQHIHHPAAARRVSPRVLRRQARPQLLMAGLLLAAGIARLAVHLTGEAAIVATAMASLVLVATFVGSLVGHHRHYPHGRWALACAAATCVWITTTTLAGITWDTVGVLTLPGHALALPYWRRHRVPYPTAPRPTVEQVVGPIPRLWSANVAGPKGPLPGTHLFGRRQIRAGERYIIQLVPGAQTFETAVDNLGRIATGLRMDPSRVIIERGTVAGLEDSSQLVLTVVTRPPISRTQTATWPGPSTYNDGLIALGPYVDGEGVGRWRLYSEHSMWGGFVVGGTGSGKSRTLDAIALAAAGAGNTVIWYADGQAGASSPHLAHWYDWSAAEEAIGDMLLAANRIIDHRQDENLVYGLEGFTPSPERPGVLIVVDECHNVFANPDWQALAARIAREGRKCGVAIIAATHLPTVAVFGSQTGDAANVLRSSLCMGNLAAANTTYKGTGNLIPGLSIDPITLPAIPGYLYLADRGGAGRSAALRAYYVANPKHEAQSVAMPQLDLASATAAGDTYTTRHEAHQRRVDAAAERIAALRAGIKPDRNTTSKPAASSAPAPDHTPAATGQQVGHQAPTTAQVIAFPTYNPTAAPATSSVAVDLTPAQKRVLDAITSGHTSPAQLQRATGWSEKYIRDLLDQLQDKGRVVKVGRGVYKPAA